MKIKIKEIYIKRTCTKKTTKEKGNCAVLDPDTKKQTSCYDDCDTARAAKHATNEEQLEEISAMGGGAVAFAQKPKELDEMYSTMGLMTGETRGYVDELEGFKERSKYHKLKNVPKRIKIKIKRK